MAIDGMKVIDLDSHLVGDLESWPQTIEAKYQEFLPRKLPTKDNERRKTLIGNQIMIGSELGRHCASLTQGEPGILHGALSYLLQDADGQVVDTHSISAGLDYPGVGPEHAYLQDAGLARYVSATDDEAMVGFQLLARTEGILPALEPAHVIGWLARRELPEGSRILVCLSGRGDKDLETVRAALGTA